ncbi:MAG: hypothetical protein MK105_14330 [Crocinitomicaceae bacterium]|nr:hypothetical protein [Crocinitomicaceae bacterium]
MEIKLIVKNTIELWLIMTALILPFPYAIIPSIKFAASESSLIYLLSFTLIILSCIVNVLLLFYNSVDTIQFSRLTRTIGTYLLALFLIKYGVDKLFQNQFYSPEPNILHTPIGQLTKDIVFWTSMNTSSSYNIFIGCIEICSGLLLFSNRFRLIAIIMSIGITANIFMINVGFDISVKFLSGYLFILSIYLTLFYASHVLKALTDIAKIAHNIKRHEQSKLNRFVKSTVIGVIIIECLLPYSAGMRHRRTSKELFGNSYEFEQAQQIKLIPYEIKRIHFHKQGYLVTESQNHEFEDCRIHASPLRNEIMLKELNQVMNYKIDSNQLILTLNSNQYKLTEVDNTSLPLLEDSFHWTTESFPH